MSGLQIQYSKEVAKELTKIAVCLPGSPVEVGQIIHFPFGREGFFPFRQASPRGAFNIITTLANLNIQPQVSAPDTDEDPYIFASKRSVKVTADFGAQGAIGSNATADGTLKATFDSAGSVYFAAVGCKTTNITNLDQIQVDLAAHANQIIWDDTFLVTSVTTARKALIMQSSTKEGALDVGGDIKGLVTGNLTDISANANIGVKSFKEASFIKPWSDNVTVFIGLHKFTKVAFGHTLAATVSRMAPFERLELSKMAGQLVHSDKDKYALQEVSALDILNDKDREDMVS